MTPRTDNQTALRNAQAPAHTFIVPAKSAQAPLPDAYAENPEVQRLRSKLAQAQAEVDALRAEATIAKEVRHIVTSAPPSWTARDRLIAVAMIVTAEATAQPNGYRPVPHSAESLGVVVGMAGNTARKALQRLHGAGLADYAIDRTPVNRYGEPLNTGVSMDESRGDRWETATILAIKPMTGKLPDLGEVATEVKARERAQAQRDELARLRAAMTVIENATCPHCGVAHGLQVVCGACGTFTQVDDLQVDDLRDDDPDQAESQSLRFCPGPDQVILPPQWAMTLTDRPTGEGSESQSLPEDIYSRKVCVSDMPGESRGTEGRAQGGAVGPEVLP